MNWRPTAAIATLHARALLLADIRSFFQNRDYLEIDVPAVALAPTSDPWIDSFSVFDIEKNHIGYLLSSPEPYLKRCLAEFKRPIYTITHAFRASERGHLHAAEFTMLEWYRPIQELRLDTMIEELDELVTTLTNFSKPTVIEYGVLFDQVFGLNPHQANKDDLVELAKDHVEIELAINFDFDGLLDFLFATQIQPKLDCHVVIEFPAEQASLSRIEINRTGDKIAKRIELYLFGVEIANGYDELVDVNEQKIRFDKDRLKRMKLNRPEVPEDFELIQALTAGLPNSYGVALGIDRLLMVMLGKRTLKSCMVFRDI